MDQLYVDLISNSNHLRDHDTNTNFTTISKTPPSLSDNKDYLVGLVSINIPNAFDIINSDTCYVMLKTRYYTPESLNVQINSKETFLEEINCELRKYRLIMSLSSDGDNNYQLSHLSDYPSDPGGIWFFENEVFKDQTVSKGSGINESIELIFEKPGPLRIRIEYFKYIDHHLRLSELSRTSQDILDDINKQLNQTLRVNQVFFELTDKGHTRYNGLEIVKIPGTVNNWRLNSLELSENLAAIFGFRNKRIFNEHAFHFDPNDPSRLRLLRDTTISADLFDTNAGFRYAFVYSDIVENSLVGGEQAPLLNIVPIDSRNDMTCFQPAHISYKRLTHRNLDTIRLYINTETGSSIKYSNRTSPITARLHIKERQDA
jgi:hypothetical protein